jgi:hypothetical protein
MQCPHIRAADGPEVDVPVLDYVLLVVLLLACLSPLLLR